jgi:uncharacterized phage protein (TIGR01671 family)
MKREIKFKARMTGTENWITGLPYSVYNNGIDAIKNEQSTEYIDIDTLGQFTGQIDCNENEIYEGDIIKTGTDKVMVIGWSQKHASFVIDREGWAFLHYFGEAFDGKDCEVIGNKYENPELLLPACDALKC